MSDSFADVLIMIGCFAFLGGVIGHGFGTATSAEASTLDAFCTSHHPSWTYTADDARIGFTEDGRLKVPCNTGSGQQTTVLVLTVNQTQTGGGGE